MKFNENNTSEPSLKETYFSEGSAVSYKKEYIQ
jgi:hypothetical protein